MMFRIRDWWAYRSIRCMFGFHAWVERRHHRYCSRPRCAGQEFD